MDLEKSIEFLVEHVSVLSANMATKEEVGSLRDEVNSLRNEFRHEMADLKHSMTRYMEGTSILLSTITKSTLNLEDRVQALEGRMNDFEKRLPPKAA